MNCTRRALVRCVSEILRDAAAPCAAVIPGTISTGIFARSSAAISSLARPKIMGSPAFSRTTRLPDLASPTISALISSCLHEGA